MFFLERVEVIVVGSPIIFPAYSKESAATMSDSSNVPQPEVSHTDSDEALGSYSRHVIVTGAKGGIGRACVRQLEQAGYLVTGWDLPELDVMDAARVAQLCDQAEREKGPVWGLVHCAGVMEADYAVEKSFIAQNCNKNSRIDTHRDTRDVADADVSASTAGVGLEAAWRNMRTNFFGVVTVCSQVAARLCARKAGSIVVVASNAGSTPRVGMASYGASKAAALSWVQTLGLECASCGVRCNTVSPGSTDTPMLRGMWPSGEDRSAAVVAGSPEDFRLGIPLRKLATADDVARVCLFLLGEQAGHVTMQDLKVDGGATF